LEPTLATNAIRGNFFLMHKKKKKNRNITIASQAVALKQRTLGIYLPEGGASNVIKIGEKTKMIV